jgi:hypothetical protein
MKRIATWLLIIILTFGLGVTATFLYLKLNTSGIQKSETLAAPALPDEENGAADLPILSFCELAEKPEKYNGKIVRLSGRITFGLEGAWFSDSNCGDHDNSAIVSYKNEDVWNPVKQAREGGKFWANALDVVVTGKFKNEVYRDCCLTAPFQFEISKVEKASKTN